LPPALDEEPNPGHYRHGWQQYYNYKHAKYGQQLGQSDTTHDGSSGLIGLKLS